MKEVFAFVVLALVPLLASAGSIIGDPTCGGLGNPCPATVPEPGALSLMMMGLAVIGAIKLRNKFRK